MANKTVNAEEQLEKAGIVMLALGPEAASAVMKLMNPREVQRLGTKMKDLKNLTQDKINQAALECVEKSRNRSALGMDSDDYIKQVMTNALGEEKAGFLLDRMMQGNDTSGIESLKWLDAGSVSELIKNEHPQIIATILVHLERDQAAAILNKLGEKLRREVVIRISTLDGIQPNALRELNEVFATVLSGGDKIKKSTLGGSKAAAEIMNYVGTSTEQNIFEGLREYDSDLANRIEEEMFVFDDLSTLDDRSLQTVLKEVDGSLWIPALKGVSESLKKRIFSCMTREKAENLMEELETAPPIKLADVERAQKDILKEVRRLDEQGTIVINNGGEEAYA